MNNKLFVNFGELIFNENILQWNLTYTAYYKQLTFANDLKKAASINNKDGEAPRSLLWNRNA